MKREKLITALWACFLSFIISVASIACLVTGFDMAVDLPIVALWCGIAAVVSTLCYTFPVSLLPILVVALAGGYLWQNGSLELSIQSLLFRISRLYNSVYGWGIIRLNMYTSDDMELTLWLGLCFIGALVAMGVSWTVCRRKNGFVGVLPASLLLALCFVATDTVPDAVWLYFALFGMLLFMLTHTTRRTDEPGGNRLSMMAVLPLAICLLILFVAVPQNSYKGQALAKDMETAILENKLVQAVFFDLTEKGTSGSSVDGSSVQLDRVGVRIQSQGQILQVEADFTGTIYLRGRAMDEYDGIKWTTSKKTYNNLPGGNEPQDTRPVTITTRYAHRMKYAACQVRSMESTAAGVENTEQLTQYVSQCSMEQVGELRSKDFDFDTGNYLHLTESVKRWAKPLAVRLTKNCTGTYVKAQAIAEYVKNTAKYDLNTSKMPARERDFARWFLEDSETGYCIHFATAAAVLLQAAEIPARYVVGYTAQVEAGGYTIVRSCDAHAWVEYWIPGFGWTILEATPAAQEQTEETLGTEQIIPGDTNAPSVPEGQLQYNPLILVFVGIGVALAAVLVLILRCLVLSSMRRKRLTQGTPQQITLALWNEITRLARYLGDMPPMQLLDIAQKAKFSPHVPTEEDMEKLREYLQESVRRLKHRSVFHRLWYKVVLVLY